MACRSIPPPYVHSVRSSYNALRDISLFCSARAQEASPVSDKRKLLQCEWTVLHHTVSHRIALLLTAGHRMAWVVGHDSKSSSHTGHSEIIDAARPRIHRAEASRTFPIALRAAVILAATRDFEGAQSAAQLSTQQPLKLGKVVLPHISGWDYRTASHADSSGQI